MGVLDDAIRQHLELKRAHGAAEDEVQVQEQEALGPARREAPAAEVEPEPSAEAGPEPEPALEAESALEAEPREAEPLEEGPHEEGAEEEDVLEETPEFLQETPDHDRLWFEQKPPRDFDFDE